MDLESATSDDGVTRKVKSLPEALKRFTSTETLGCGNEWRCSGCKGLVEAEKRLTVFKVTYKMKPQRKPTHGGSVTSFRGLHRIAACFRVR